ncbi:MAG: hypothetical protein KC503_28975 [Myxococcales bacterium]|nr:hypothetical protein [Myxococcales bacterium]
MASYPPYFVAKSGSPALDWIAARHALPDWWTAEDPGAELVARLGALVDDKASDTRLRSIAAAITRAGVAWDDRLAGQLPTRVSLTVTFRDTCALKLWAPYAGDFSELTGLVDWQLPDGYQRFLRLADGCEAFTPRDIVEHEHYFVLGETAHYHVGGAAATADSTEMLRGEDFLADIFADPDEFDFTADDLALNAPADHVAFVADTNSDFVCFHRQFPNARGEPAVLHWFHDADGGFDESFRRSAAKQPGFGWWLIAWLWGHVTESDFFPVLRDPP